MWISVESRKCYVSLTKEILEERVKAHLWKARKAREEWKRRERTKDEEIMGIHWEIARKPWE